MILVLVLVLMMMMMMMMIVSIAVLILAQRLMVLMMIVTIIVVALLSRTLMVTFTPWRIPLLLFNDGLLQVEHWKLMILPIQAIPLVATTVGRSITVIVIVAIICMVLQCWIQCRYAGWMQCIASMGHTTGDMMMMRWWRIHDTGPTLIVTRQAPTSRSGQIGQQFAW